MAYHYPNKSKILFFGIGLLIILSGCVEDSSRDVIPKKQVKINGHIIEVELPQTPEAKYQGLSYRESICNNCGMLFSYSQKDQRTFVMRNMNFPLDMLWIQDRKIVAIDKNLPPNGQGYTGPPSIDKILEVNGGFCKKNNISAGDKIKIIK